MIECSVRRSKYLAIREQDRRYGLHSRTHPCQWLFRWDSSRDSTADRHRCYFPAVDLCDRSRHDLSHLSSLVRNSLDAIERRTLLSQETSKRRRWEVLTSWSLFIWSKRHICGDQSCLGVRKTKTIKQWVRSEIAHNSPANVSFKLLTIQSRISNFVVAQCKESSCSRWLGTTRGLSSTNSCVSDVSDAVEGLEWFSIRFLISSL